MGKKDEANDFFKLTPGARAARRGSVASRPWDRDWDKQQVVNVCDVITSNLWVREKLGANIDVSVRMSDDGNQLAFILSKGGTWPEGGMGGMPPMQSRGQV